MSEQSEMVIYVNGRMHTFNINTNPTKLAMKNQLQTKNMYVDSTNRNEHSILHKIK